MKDPFYPDKPFEGYEFVPPTDDARPQNTIKTDRDPKSRHYDAGGIEVQDIIKAKLTPEQYEGWLLGNCIKYSCRMNFKGQKERDQEKLSFYSMWLQESGVK